MLTLTMAPGVVFHATAASVGLKDGDQHPVGTTAQDAARAQMIWNTIEQAGQRLARIEPQGSC